MSNRPPEPAAEHAAVLLDKLVRLAECGSSQDILTLLAAEVRQNGQYAAARLLVRDDEGRFMPCHDHDPPPALDWLTALPDPPGVAARDDGRELVVSLSRTRPTLLWAALREPAERAAFLVPLSVLLHAAGRQLEHAYAFESLQAALTRQEHSERLQRALFDIADLAGADLAMSDMLRRIHAIVGTLMYAENFFIVRHYPESGWIRFLYYVDAVDDDPPAPDFEIPMRAVEHSLTWHLLHGGRALMGSSEDLRHKIEGPVKVIGPDSFDWLGVPMLREGRVEGGLVVQRYEPGTRFTEEDRAVLEFVGSHILTALERRESKDALENRVRVRTAELAQANAVLTDEIEERERAEKLQAALFQIAQLAGADIDQDAFYRRVHAVVGELVDARNFFIALLSEDGARLEFPYYVDETGGEALRTRPLGRGFSEYVIRSRNPLRGTKTELQGLIDSGEVVPVANGLPSEHWLGVPLFVGEEVIGLIVVQSYTADTAYEPADQELLGFVASQIANSLDRRRQAELLRRANADLERRVEERTRELREEIRMRESMQEQLKHQVMHDALTGLPNRGYLRDRLERLLARLKREPGHRFALLYLDVDRFKVINDSLGHLSGDEVLKEVSRRLLVCLRAQDIAARLSGDEFCILLEEIDVPTAVRVAERVIRTVAEPVRVAGKTLEPSISIGIAVSNAGYHTADEVLRDADMALYRAKETGRHRVVLFDDGLQKRAVDVLMLESELRTALAEDQFLPYFQPIMRLDSGAVVGYEALLRWQHPTRGLLGPGEFLSVAEECGLIEAIDWRMFELSCKQAAALCADGGHININVSARHLRRPDLHARLMELLRANGLNGSQLMIEVTEGMLLEQPELVRATLEKLAADGVHAALDDFGTGYSSLSYLHTFPLRVLKLDRSFVTELDRDGRGNSTAVVTAVVQLARALGMEVIAEGIETEYQRDAITAMGCWLGQGYLLAWPAPMNRWLAKFEP